jgi:hypothetical protein
MPYLLQELMAYAMFGGAGYLGLRIVRAYERRCIEPTRSAELVERLRAVEDALEQVEARIEQTAEAQRFTMAVISGGTNGSVPRLGSRGQPST